MKNHLLPFLDLETKQGAFARAYLTVPANLDRFTLIPWVVKMLRLGER